MHHAARSRVAPRSAAWWALAVLLLAASALTYQSHALFYFVPVAAGLRPRRRRAARPALDWLALAFTIMMGSSREGACRRRSA